MNRTQLSNQASTFTITYFLNLVDPKGAKAGVSEEIFSVTCQVMVNVVFEWPLWKNHVTWAANVGKKK